VATVSPVQEHTQAGLRLQRPARLAAALHLWHLTSLDAPTVAVVWTLAFAHAVQVNLPLWLPVVLALVAWSMYIGDRLMDVYGEKRRGGLSRINSLRPRHHFHWQHRQILLPVAIGSAAIAAALVLHSMPVAARERNSLLAAAALAYFGGVHSPWRARSVRLKLPLRLPKELLVGILFTLACAVPAWSRISAVGPQRLVLLPAILAFILLAWLNCHAIEVWESGALQREWRIRPLSLVLCGAAFAAALAFEAWRQPLPAALLLAAAAAALLTAALDRFRHRMDATTLRAAADLVLLTPVALLLWS